MTSAEHEMTTGPGLETVHIAVNGWFLGQGTTGSGQYVAHLLAHLPPIAPNVRWSCLLPVTKHSRDRVLPTLPGVTLQPIRLPAWPENVAKLWWEQVRVPQLARRLGADLLWVPYWAAPFWQPLPVVVTVHDLIPALLPAYRGGWLQRRYTDLMRLTTRRAAAILTVSRASALDIVAHLAVPAERVQVVYHGPNHADHLRPDEATQAAVRLKYQLPDRFFLYLGGFDLRKNVSMTLSAYRRYLDQGGDAAVRLVIAGRLPSADTPFTPDPQRVAAALKLEGQVQFCGYVDEVEKAALYALATAYLFPSLYEGFGMMVVEAMDAGTPVITSAEFNQ